MSFTIKIACKLHPRYAAKKQPRGGCVDCQRMYDLRRDAAIAASLHNTVRPKDEFGLRGPLSFKGGVIISPYTVKEVA